MRAVAAKCFVTLTCLWTACASSHRYYVSRAGMTLHLPTVAVDTAGPFKVLILRKAEDSTSLHLLEVAEATFPPRREVLAAFAGTPQERSVLRREPDLWWYSASGTRVPYAVTGAAVRYYLGRLAELRRVAESESPRSGAASRSAVVYRASIDRREHYEIEGQVFAGVYVAQMRLSWTEYCGSLCAVMIYHERTVVLNAAGVVLLVVGDGPQGELVS